MRYLTLSIMFILGFGLFTAYAHVDVDVGPYNIDVGWRDEPPVVGFRNEIVFEISEPGETEGVKSPVTSAFINLDAIVRFGGLTKQLDISSDPRPGKYFSKIIPTKTGSIIIELKGEINGVSVDIELPMEDVESTAVLDFPPKGTAGTSDFTPLKNALSSLQKDVLDIKSKVGGVDTSAGEFNVEDAYNFAVFGLSLGAAGVILAKIAMIKRK